MLLRDCPVTTSTSVVGDAETVPCRIYHHCPLFVWPSNVSVFVSRTDAPSEREFVDGRFAVVSPEVEVGRLRSVPPSPCLNSQPGRVGTSESERRHAVARAPDSEPEVGTC